MCREDETVRRLQVFCKLWLGAVVACGCFAAAAVCAGQPGDVVFRVVMVEDENGQPAATGRVAAQSLLKAMGGVPLKAVIVSECFEDRAAKEKLLDGICSAVPRELVLGGATYGSFWQHGCSDFDAVALLGIGGQDVRVASGLVTDMGTAKLVPGRDEKLIAERLHKAGQRLAAGLPRSDRDRLLILIADAHHPKNRYLVEGVQKVLGKEFPITGGCVNKNAGQTFVYYQGAMYADSAVGILLAGDFHVSLAGRRANEGPAVIRTAREAAQQALRSASGRPVAALAFDCAGRRGKLDRHEDELEAMQQVLGKEVPLFGCYCAGEMGPVDDPAEPSDAFCGGSGWHVMFTIISQ